jgi:hypothetical protein
VYRHLSYAQIAQELEELATQYPDYVKVDSAWVKDHPY